MRLFVFLVAVFGFQPLYGARWKEDNNCSIGGNIGVYLGIVVGEEIGTIPWWLCEKSNEPSRTCFAFSQEQIDATDNKILIPVAEKHLKYIEQAIRETDFVQANIKAHCQQCEKLLRGKRLRLWIKYNKINFERCMNKIAQEKVYFTKLLETIKNFSMPAVTERDIVRIFRFFRCVCISRQADCNPPCYRIKMTKKKSLGVYLNDPRLNDKRREGPRECDWLEARRIIACHQHFEFLIKQGWISCKAPHPYGLSLPYYHPRYMQHWAYRGEYDNYGPYFQERLTWHEHTLAQQKHYMGELLEVYDVQDDPRTQGLENKEDKIKALCIRPKLDVPLFGPIKQLMNVDRHADL
jgi:hypothetical protein